MILHYHKVIIDMLRNEKYDDSFHRTIVHEYPREPAGRYEEDKSYVPMKGNHQPPIPRHSKWMVGRSPVTLHR